MASISELAEQVCEDFAPGPKDRFASITGNEGSVSYHSPGREFWFRMQGLKCKQELEINEAKRKKSLPHSVRLNCVDPTGCQEDLAVCC